MKRLENKLDNKEDMKETYDTIKNELEQTEEEKLRGNIIRSRAQWIEEGEKCRKYFMQLENRNYRAKCITSLKKEEKIITEQKAILEECKQFYKSLYSEPATEKDFENCKFLKTKHKILDEIDKEVCKQKNNIDECYQCLQKFPNNKSPGNDGLSVEFYKYFWKEIKSYLMVSYNYSFENNLLSMD